MLSQIRALPNPAYLPPKTTQAQPIHPLTLYLSQTSTANIVITLLTLALLSSAAFAKLAPDTEVIITPKTRPRLSRVRRESQSATNRGRVSTSGRSAMSGVRSRSHRQESASKAIFLRGLNRAFCTEWFEDTSEDADARLKIWLDSEIISSKLLQDSDYACVSIVRPTALEAPPDPHQQPKTKDQEPKFHALKSLLEHQHGTIRRMRNTPL